MVHYYKIYGLIVKSELELPEAYEVEEQKAEVVIMYGVMPDYIRKKIEKKCYFSIAPESYKWFHNDGEGHFLVENGTNITLELENGIDEKRIRAYVLGICLSTILYQRKIISIHGSAVIWKDNAIIISGSSGAGKSTLSTELLKRGCSFMADDTVAITGENGVIYANPAYPQQKLCTDAAIASGYKLEELILINEEREKYAVRLKKDFYPDRCKIAAMVCIDISENDKLSIHELKGSIKLEYIIKNQFSYGDYNYFGMKTDIFKKCLEMAQKVPVIKVERPANRQTVEQISEYIMNFIQYINEGEKAYGF